MGLFDKFGGSLKDVLGQVEAAAVPALVSAGTNLPISPDQLRSTLGNQQVQQIARQLGLPVDEALKVLSEHLPTAVDQASPNGTLQPVQPAG